VVLLVFFTTSVFAVENEAGFAGGTGAADSPFLISTAAHLNNVRNYPFSHFKLTADIVFTEADFLKNGCFYNAGMGWQPIGSSAQPFRGTFIGCGHTISGLYINSFSESDIYAGLFGYTSNANISNFSLINTNITVRSESSTRFIGGIVGNAHGGSISDCFFSGALSSATVSAATYTGGIAGKSGSNITGCYSAGSITSESESGNTYAGGITGHSTSSITNCHNTGVLTATSKSGTVRTGGITGSSFLSDVFSSHNTGSLTSANDSGNIMIGGITGDASNNETSHCYNTGKLSSTNVSGSSRIGGIIGSGFTAALKDCQNKGAVSSTNELGYNTVAGISGSLSNGTVFFCGNTGVITSTGDSGSSYAGGIAGSTDGSIIERSSNAATLTASSQSGAVCAGGIAANASRVSITDCYNADAAVSASTQSGAAYVGGILGRISGGDLTNCYSLGNITITDKKIHTKAGGITGCIFLYGDLTCNQMNCYYPEDSKRGVGYGNDTCRMVPSEDMLIPSTYEGFDFSNIWEMSSNNGYAYPVLRGIH